VTTFTVPGLAIPQGSKRAFPLRNGKVALVESAGDRHKLWRHAVNDAARAAYDQPPLTGPVAVTAHFSFTRPASHPKRRRTWPTGARSGDIDKLARAVLDSLSGVCFVNDAQVVELAVSKDWGSRPGVVVTVNEIAA
jgi:crossover junction endodeoxyribonuclease RusA